MPRVIPFSQSNDVIRYLHPQQDYIISNINRQYNGLCEIICNLVLVKDFLGKGSRSHYLRNRITIKKLNNDTIKKSHIMVIYSFFHKISAYLFGIYPDNIFFYVDQWHLVKKGAVNRQILQQGLSNIPKKETLKLEVFGRSCLNLQGHSLLIKKTSTNSFIFFDPNTGEHRNLSFVELSNKIDWLLTAFQASDICLIRGNDYLNRLREAGLSLHTT